MTYISDVVHPRRGDCKWVTGWSPEQISNRLQTDFSDESMRSSHEAISGAVYQKARSSQARAYLLPTHWAGNAHAEGQDEPKPGHMLARIMSRRVNCWNNAAMESFFWTLKIERLSKEHQRTKDDLRADVFGYVK